MSRVRRYHAEGEYREITPPERLVYTHYWLTDDTPVETLITIEFHEQGDATRKRDHTRRNARLSPHGPTL